MFAHTAARIVENLNAHKKHAESGDVIALSEDTFSSQVQVESVSSSSNWKARASEWVKSAATGSYLETVSLREVIAESRISDFHLSDSIVKDMAKVSALVVPFVAAGFLFWVACIGVFTLTVITHIA